MDGKGEAGDPARQQQEEEEGSDAAASTTASTAGSKPRRRRRAARSKESKLENYDALNWRIHQLYTEQRFDDCDKLIELALQRSQSQCDYALYVRGMILKAQGQLKEAQTAFQEVLRLRPTNHHAALQIARCLYLSGKFRAALDVFDQAAEIGVSSWRVHHDKSMCHVRLKQYDQAEQLLGRALAIYNNALSLQQLARVRILTSDLPGAAKAYEEALKISPEDTEIMTSLGLLYLRMGQPSRAFELFGTCLTYDPRDTRAILAAASIIQDNEDYDVALVKYRISAVLTPESAELWNNIGMCFFGKQKYVAAIACLKRAAYLAPFEWMVAFNLGLVHLTVGQHASAYHFFSASVKLRPKFAPAYGLLGVTLHNLKDPESADTAFKRAIQLDPSDPITHINYAVMLFEHGDIKGAAQQFSVYETIADNMEGFKEEHGDCVHTARLLQTKLKTNNTSTASAAKSSTTPAATAASSSAQVPPVSAVPAANGDSSQEMLL
ncbi:hypothetical protein PTSG_10970 [Salpingoeca rosetta]|uniref:Uncharacterized protein n=1 Tax=Salpingoeca rosetta (strain ATCC 50818 / BSB-021) TaxID=946362 RepID=F2USB8_SALR5|nr:uncharacterized protein PTSG_10970 [Salpingoeca rosetta]EGD81027.1 hypothetical protein PTSG_10970 [Salpingoeca rosetta]|eukprot:XP_004987897.1 hypothetical protein PTSG_10970 [Salpingoeca rosetta]